MKSIADQTRIDSRDCITFEERKNQMNYLEIKDDVGCFSSVGKYVKTVPQTMSLDKSGCLNLKTIVHELVHALGKCSPFILNIFNTWC